MSKEQELKEMLKLYSKQDLWNRIQEKQAMIYDLEAKLAESEERVKDLEFRNKNLEHSLKVAPNANAGQRQRIVELKEINHKLKQQLAEKEAERELDNAFWKQECDSLQKALAEKEKAIKTMQESSDKNIDYLIEFTSLIKNQKDCDRMLEALERVKTDKKHQNKISFAVDILEELADCSNYINSKLDFESGSYVSEKSIRDKIKYLKGNKYE